MQAVATSTINDIAMTSAACLRSMSKNISEAVVRYNRDVPDWRVVRRWLLVGVAVVAGLGLGAEALHARSHADIVEALLTKLSLSYEGNLPTWFSSSLLLGCAVAAGVIAAARPPLHRQWWVMSLVAGWMSLDEAAELHEHLGGYVGTGGVLYFDWVIPAAVIVAALVIAFIPFVRALNPATRTRLLVAGAVYVGGALLMELPLGWWTEQHGTDGFGYAVIDWVEETLEMVGAALALSALLAHRDEAGA